MTEKNTETQSATDPQGRLEALVRFCWMRISDGEIAQGKSAESAEELFLSSGFGPVDVDRPIKGYMAVRCKLVAGDWVKI